jgi:hypothetical protein
MHLIILAFGGFLLFGQTHQQGLDVTAANGRLTVHVSSAALRDVVREISRLTGIQVTGDNRLTGPISDDFSDLPTTEALERILVHVNYLIVKVPRSKAATSEQLAVYIHSMSSADDAATETSGPIHAPALETLIALDAADEEEPDDDTAAEDEEDEKEPHVAHKGEIDPNTNTRDLITIADDDDAAASVRAQALNILGNRPLDRASLEALVRALSDDSSKVRSAAIEVLGRATDSASLETVGRLLDEPDDDNDEHLQISALRVLALRADAASVPHLLILANAQEGNPTHREAANQIVAQLLDRKAKQTR